MVDSLNILIGLMTTIALPVIAKKSGEKGKGLSQIPSVATDFRDNAQ